MQPQTFAIVDAIALGCIIGGAIQGFLRGLSGEMARVLGAICAFVAGALLHEPVGEWIATYTRLESPHARTLTYGVTVLTALLLWALFHKLIRSLLQLVLRAEFDKFAGIPAGIIRMATFVGIVLIAIHIAPWAPFKQHVGETTVSGRIAIRLVPAVERQLHAHKLQIPGTTPLSPDGDENPHIKDAEP